MVDAAPWELPGDVATTPNRPLVPRHLRLHELFGDDWKAVDPVTGRRLVLGNARRADLLRGGRRDQPALPQRDRRRVRLRRVRQRRGRDGVRRAGRPPGRLRDAARGPPRTAGCRPGTSRCGSTRSRPTPTSRRPSATCPGTGSCWSTPRTASATCTARPSRCWSTATDVEVYVKHRGPGRRDRRHPVRGARPTRSTWSAGTAASTRTRSTSPTSSRSPAGCTSRRRCTRCSRATTS